MMIRELRSVAWAVIASMAVAGVCHAEAWRVDGTPVAPSAATQTGPIVCSDGAGGAYIAWQDGGGIQLQRVSPSGTPAPGWPDAGLFGAGGRWGETPVLAPDGNGGVFLAWNGGNAFNYSHVSPAGTFVTATAGSAPAGGRVGPEEALKEAHRYVQALSPDPPTGGAYLCWEYSPFGCCDRVEVGRLLPNGLIDPAWPWGSRVDSTGASQVAPALCADGAGGMLVTWVGYHPATGEDIAASRLTPEGTLAPGWARGGMPVCRAGGDQDAVGIVADGTGGALIVWHDLRSGVRQLYAQHLTADGVPAAGWPLDGICVCRFATAPGRDRTRDRYPHASVAADGAGGIYIAWTDQRADAGDIYLQHLQGDGHLAPGWAPDGVPVCSAPGTQARPAIAADQAGVVVAWEQPGLQGADIAGMRMSADGHPDPAWTHDWPAAGLLLCAQPWPQALPDVALASDGAMIAVWQDDRCDPTRAFASRVTADGTTPAAPPLAAPWATWQGWEAIASRLRVSWQVTGASGPVDVQRSERGGPWSVIGTVAPDGAGRAEFADSTVLAGCPYHYRVTLGTCGARPFGEDSVDVPSAAGIPRPTATLRSVQLAEGAVTVAWDAPARDSLTTGVERAEPCGNGWTTIVSSRDPTGAVHCRDTGLLEGRRYAYRVRLHACGRDELTDPTWVEIPAGRGFLRLAADLVGAYTVDGDAHLSWRITAGSSTTLRLYRLGAPGDTTRVTTRALQGSTDFAFDDHGLAIGSRVGWQIGLQYDGTGVDCRAAEQRLDPVWLDIGEAPPPAPGTPGLAVAGVAELSLRVFTNPSQGTPSIAIGLPSPDPARLELYDPGGRLLWHDEVDGLGVGVHVLPLTGAMGRAPGLYLLRLRQRDAVRTARLTLLH